MKAELLGGVLAISLFSKWPLEWYFLTSRILFPQEFFSLDFILLVGFLLLFICPCVYGYQL